MQDDGPKKPINLQDKFLETGVTDFLRDAKTGGPVLHPIVIYQSYIDELSRVNMVGDAEAWLDYSEYPYNVHTDEMDKTIQSREEARPFFDMVCKMIREQGINSFRRVAEHAEFLDPSMILGHHMTFLQKDGVDVVQPMASRMVIRNTTGLWRMISVTNAVSNKQYPYEIPEPSDGLLPMANIAARNEQMRTREAGTHKHLGIAPDETNALTIYRAFVEAFTQANVSDDFGMWCAMHRERVRKHTPDEDLTVDTNTERRAIFDAIAAEMADSRADRYRRRAVFAEWIGPNRLRGKHIAEMLRGETSVRPPIDSQFILERKHHAWKLVDVTNSASFPNDNILAKAPWTMPKPPPKPTHPSGSVVAFPGRRPAEASAMDIYQQVLTQSVDCINAPSFDCYVNAFRLPVSLHTETVDTVLATRDDMRPYFDTLVEVRETTRADRFARYATHATFLDDTLIAGHHLAHMIKDGKDVKPPVEARWLLRLIDGEWKVVSVANGLIDHDFPLNSALSAEAPQRTSGRPDPKMTTDTAPAPKSGRGADKGENT